MILAEGQVLVVGGLGESTRRHVDAPRHWRGLSGGDVALLVGWVDRFRPMIVELHTDVEVGSVPEWVEEIADPSLRRQAGSSHPLRIDAAVLTSEGWWVLEVKPRAGYHALGQLLTYRHYAGACCVELVGCRCGVVTDQVQPCIAPVFAFHGVEVFEVGGVISDRPLPARLVPDES